MSIVFLHRVNRYKAWQNYGVAALAIDYRGYADSSNIERVTEVSFGTVVSHFDV